MTDPMPGSEPKAKRYTGELAALRQGLESSVAPGHFNAEGTRRMIRGEPPPAEPSGEALPDAAAPAASATEPQGLAGRTLEDVIARLAAGRDEHFAPLAERVDLAVRLCQAVATVHAGGVLLNDIKPALVSVGLLGEVGLIERGAASPLGGTVPVTGTPAYMSPEQARGEPLGVASDLYALGATCHRLFTLRYPLWDTDPEVFWERKRRGELDPVPATVAAPPALLAICRRALAARPEDRYPHAAAMAADLQAFLDGAAVQAHPEGAGRRVLRRLARWRWALAAVAVIAIAGLLIVRSGRERDQERTRLLAQLAASEAAYATRASENEVRSQELRRRLAEVDRQRGWRQVLDLDFAKPIDPRLEAVQVNEGVRVETDALALLRQHDGVLEILPAPHRTFVRWREGISEDARIDVEVESPGAKGWNLDLTVAGDPLTGYRLRVYGHDYFALETIERGWADQLARVADPPLAGRERLAISLRHVAGRISVAVDGHELIDYLDPQPLHGGRHRSVAVGRFFGAYDVRIRRMTVWSRAAGELIGVLDPGTDLLRAGRPDEARAWFERIAAAPPTPRLGAEAEFLAALVLPAGERRRTALLALAQRPGHPLADHALFVAIDQAVQEGRLDELPALITTLRGIAPPALVRRVALNLVGHLQQADLAEADRVRLLSAFAASGHAEFRVPGVGLSDLAPLRGLAPSDVWVSNNAIADLSPLVSPALRRVQADGNLLERLPDLSGAALERLDVGGNRLADLAPLAGQAKLIECYARDCPLSGIAPLADCPALARLDLSQTAVGDLSPLRGLPLRWLALGGTPVADLASLATAPLESLHLANTRVVDLSPLSASTTLARLDLAGTAVADLRPLAGRASLRSLYLARTPVASLAPLAGLGLEELDLAGTAVTDLSPLAGLPLRVLNLARAPASDLSPLAGLPLRRLDLSGAPRGELKPLAGLKLEHLALPPGPYTAAQLTQVPRLAARELRLDPADAAQWEAAAQIQGVQRINLLPAISALAARAATEALLAGGTPDLAQLAESLGGARLVLLPVLVTRAEAEALAARVGGRLPVLTETGRFAAATRILSRSLPRSEAWIHIGVVSGAQGLRWSDGSAYRGRQLPRAELALLAAGGTVTYDVSATYTGRPADARAVLAIELPE